VLILCFYLGGGVNTSLESKSRAVKHTQHLILDQVGQGVKSSGAPSMIMVYRDASTYSMCKSSNRGTFSGGRETRL
jgi:hypothetical protein